MFVNKLLVANLMALVLSKIIICSNNKYKDIAVATPSVSNKSYNVMKIKWIIALVLYNIKCENVE